MANDRDSSVLNGLVDVVLVGGPMHGCRVLMSSPGIHMDMEPSPGVRIVYHRRMVEETAQPARPRYRATYAPEGTTDEDFANLLIDAARRA